MNIPRTITNRVLHLRCPRCGEDLQVSIAGLPPSVTAEQWLAELDGEDLDNLHTAHAGPPISVPRTRTRRITPA